MGKKKQDGKGDSSKVWSLMALVSGIAGATLAKKGLNAGWKAATGKQPPANPADPDVVVAEITHRGWSKVKQDHYTFTAVAIIHLRDGEIVRYDDYMNPLLLQELLGV